MTNILPFTAQVIESLREVMIKQDEKGLEKYGKPLNPEDENYDWLEMTIEELADALKYLESEAQKKKLKTELLEKVSTVLKNQLEPNKQQIDVVQIQFALDLVDSIINMK